MKNFKADNLNDYSKIDEINITELDIKVVEEVRDITNQYMMRGDDYLTQKIHTDFFRVYKLCKNELERRERCQKYAERKRKK